MERMVRLYGAPTEYMADCLRLMLADVGIPCIVLSNEIPQRPGFSFGADGIYADIFVTPEDEAEARIVLQDVLELVCAADGGAELVYPRRINLRGVGGGAWLLLLLPLWVYSAPSLFILRYGLELGGPDYGNGVDRYTYCLLLLLLCVTTACIVSVSWSLLHANREAAWRTLRQLGVALPAVLALPFVLLFEFARWTWGQVNFWVHA